MDETIAKKIADESGYKRADRILLNREFVSCGFRNISDSRKNVKKKFLTLIYILEGTGQYKEKSSSWDLKAGDILIRPTDIEHSLLRNKKEDWVEFFCFIPATAANFFLESHLSSTEVILNQLQPTPDLIDDMLELIQAIETSQSHEEDAIYFALHSFYIKIKNRLKKEGQEVKGLADIIKVCKIIEESPEQKWTNELMAEKAEMGVENFRKIFKINIGCPPGEYVIRCRLEKSKELLITTDHSCEKIAELMNYPDQATFTRQFKKYTGLPPNKFRQAMYS